VYLKKKIIILARVIVKYTADSFNSINGTKDVKYEEKMLLTS